MLAGKRTPRLFDCTMHVVLFLTVDLVDSHEVACQFVSKMICDDGFLAAMKGLFGLR